MHFSGLCAWSQSVVFAHAGSLNMLGEDPWSQIQLYWSMKMCCNIIPFIVFPLMIHYCILILYLIISCKIFKFNSLFIDHYIFSVVIQYVGVNCCFATAPRRRRQAVIVRTYRSFIKFKDGSRLWVLWVLELISNLLHLKEYHSEIYVTCRPDWSHSSLI